MTQSTRQRSKIKDQVSIEREIKKPWYILFHLLCYRFPLTGCNLITKYCMAILYLVYTSQTSSGKCVASPVSRPDFYCIFPPNVLFPSYFAAASVVLFPESWNVLRHLLADIVLPATSWTGEGDLLPIKGDLLAISTKVDDDVGECGACGDAEEEDEPLPLAVSASPLPR